MLEPAAIPQFRSVHPILGIRRHGVIEQLPVFSRCKGWQSHAQHAVHQIETLLLNVVGAPIGVWVHGFVASSPRSMLPDIVHDYGEGLTVGDVDESVLALALGIANVHDGGDENGALLQLSWRDLVTVEQLILNVECGKLYLLEWCTSLEGGFGKSQRNLLKSWKGFWSFRKERKALVFWINFLLIRGLTLVVYGRMQRPKKLVFFVEAFIKFLRI